MLSTKNFKEKYLKYKKKYIAEKLKQRGGEISDIHYEYLLNIINNIVVTFDNNNNLRTYFNHALIWVNITKYM